MIQAIKKKVTVLQGGRIEFSSPELKSGVQAEVIVFIPESQTIGSKLTFFIGKGKGAFSKPADVDEFLRKERDKWE